MEVIRLLFTQAITSQVLRDSSGLLRIGGKQEAMYYFGKGWCKNKRQPSATSAPWDILFTTSAHSFFTPFSFLLSLFYLFIFLIVIAPPCLLLAWSESQLTSVSAGDLWCQRQCNRPPCRTQAPAHVIGSWLLAAAMSRCCCFSPIVDTCRARFETMNLLPPTQALQSMLTSRSRFPHRL